MSGATAVSHSIYDLFPGGVEEFDSLAEVALDMRLRCASAKRSFKAMARRRTMES